MSTHHQSGEHAIAPATVPETDRVRCPECRGGREYPSDQCDACAGRGFMSRAQFTLWHAHRVGR